MASAEADIWEDVAVVLCSEAWKWKHVGPVGTPGARPVNGVCKKGY